MDPKISIVTVTKGEPHSPRFLHNFIALATALGGELVVGCDGPRAAIVVDNVRQLVQHGDATPAPIRLQHVKPDPPIIESVLDLVIAQCAAPYVLRLDDDESVSPGMLAWLKAEAYTRAEVWKFCRAHLWGNEETYLEAPQLWPDHQTRLSVKAKAGGRHWIHAGSPYGGGDLAPADAAILHHKFLVRDYLARQAIGMRYDDVQPGAGIAGGMRAFQLPEDVFTLDALDDMCRPVESLRALPVLTHPEGGNV